MTDIVQELAEVNRSKKQPAREYLLITDLNSRVVSTHLSYKEAYSTACLIRRGGGQVTIFRALKG